MTDQLSEKDQEHIPEGQTEGTESTLKLLCAG